MINLATLLGTHNLQKLINDEYNTHAVIDNNGLLIVEPFTDNTEYHKVVSVGTKNGCDRLIIHFDENMIKEKQQIEILGMEALKSKWSHLYIGDNYPTKPFPTNYENDLNNVMLGYLIANSNHSK